MTCAVIRSSFNLVAGQPEFDCGLHKILDVTGHIARNRFGPFADNICNLINGMTTVEVFPDEDADRVDAVSVSRFRIEQDRPIVEFFPEYYQGIGNNALFIMLIHVGDYRLRMRDCQSEKTIGNL